MNKDGQKSHIRERDISVDKNFDYYYGVLIHEKFVSRQFNLNIFCMLIIFNK